uniref:Uncharacterized protein n=1 Tax=Physcomitrium patens TaxID=3218 RepID=A0A2K1L862_PHYPA|nr:hypothetical protein PHYPA_000641 [Physcomitrium patens]
MKHLNTLRPFYRLRVGTCWRARIALSWKIRWIGTRSSAVSAAFGARTKNTRIAIMQRAGKMCYSIQLLVVI